jgi:hypothetical protein
MPSKRPAIHGYDHGGPGSPDPIPIQGVEYAYAAGIGTTLTHGTAVYWDMSGGASGDPPITNTPAVFGFGRFATGPATGQGGILINTMGLYHATIALQILAEDTDLTLHRRDTELLFEGSGPEFGSSFQTGNQNSMILGYQSFQKLFGIGAGGTCLVGLQTTNNDGSGGPSGHAYLLLERKDGRDYTTISLP